MRDFLRGRFARRCVKLLQHRGKRILTLSSLVGALSLFVFASQLNAQQLPISPDQLGIIQQALQSGSAQSTLGQQQYQPQQITLLPAPGQTNQGPPSRLEQIMSARAGATLSQFGYDQLGSGQPVTVPQSGAVDDDYVLGPGDEIIASFRGQESSEFTTTVDRNGNVVLPRLSPIAAAGHTLGDFREAVAAAARRSYISTQVFISVGNIRQITVLVTGEVLSPGQRLVTGLSSPADAILLSGGIKKTGSLRNVKIIRGNREISVDLYTILTQRGTAKPIHLMSGDRIVVPPLGKTVAVAGWVRNPGIYELPAGSSEVSVKTLLSLAGGLEVRGRYRLSILRVLSNGSSAMTGLNGEAGVIHDSEILFAEIGAQQTDQGATLSGGTPLAGVYSVGKTTKLSQVLSAPGAMGDNPYAAFGLIVRQNSVTHVKDLVAFTPAAVLNGREDLDLTSHDVVRVFSSKEAALLSAVLSAYAQARDDAENESRAPQTLVAQNIAAQQASANRTSLPTTSTNSSSLTSLLGQTQGQSQGLPQTPAPAATNSNVDLRPNTEREDIALLSNKVLGDGGSLVPQSNTFVQQIASGSADHNSNQGPSVSALQQYLASSQQSSQSSSSSSRSANSNQTVIPTPTYPASAYIPLPPNMQRQSGSDGGFPSNQEVQTFGDLSSQLQIDPLVLINFLTDHEVVLAGAVLGPGTYLVGPNANLQDLVSAAGGTRGWVDQSGVEIISTSIDAIHGVSRTSRQLLPIQASNLASYVVHPHDEVRFREVYANVGAGSVTLQGQVRYPGTYSIERGEKLSELLLRAGGLTDVAYPYGTVFLRKSAADQERVGFQKAADEIENAFLVGMTRIGEDKASPAGFAAIQDFINQLKTTPPVGRISIIADPAMLVANPERDTLLENNDVIYIPQRTSIVTVLGQVNQPGSFPFNSGESVEAYVDQAGGYSEIADKSNTYIVFPDGTAKPVESSWFNFNSADIPPGSTIYVARDLAPLDLRQIIIDVSTIMREFALSAASLAVISRRN